MTRAEDNGKHNNIHFLIQKHILCLLVEPLMGMLLLGNRRTFVKERALEMTEATSFILQRRWEQSLRVSPSDDGSQDKNPALLILRSGLSFQISPLLPLWVPVKLWHRQGSSDEKSHCVDRLKELTVLDISLKSHHFAVWLCNISFQEVAYLPDSL